MNNRTSGGIGARLGRHLRLIALAASLAALTGCASAGKATLVTLGTVGPEPGRPEFARAFAMANLPQAPARGLK